MATPPTTYAVVCFGNVVVGVRVGMVLDRLAVPVMLAGIRTALVINVGMAALATFMGAAIVAQLALVIDSLAALAERYLRPKGI